MPQAAPRARAHLEKYFGSTPFIKLRVDFLFGFTGPYVTVTQFQSYR